MNIFGRKAFTTIFLFSFISGTLLAGGFIPETRQIIAHDFSYQVEAPRNWRQVNLGDNALSVGNPQQDAYAMLFSGSPDNLKETTFEEFFQKRASALEKNIEVTSRKAPVKSVINSMQAMQYEVTGREEGLAITYILALLQGEKKLVMVVAWSNSQLAGKNRKDIQTLINSISELPGNMINPAARKFAELSGLDRLIQHLHGQFNALVQSLMNNPQMLEKSKTAFSEQYLAPFANRYVSNLADLDKITKINNRLEQKDFQKIRLAEEETNKPESLEEMKKFLETFQPDAPEHAARMKIMRDLMSAGNSSQQISAVFPLMWESVMLSMIDISQMEEPPSQKDLSEKVDQFYQASLEKTTQSLPARYFYIYRDIPDQDLLAYIKFMKSPEGQYMNELIRKLIPCLIWAGGYEFTGKFR